MTKFLIGFALFLSLYAEDKPKPQITLEQQAEWLQARAELAEAKIMMLQAEAKINAIVANMQTVCPLVLKDGRPECQPKEKR